MNISITLDIDPGYRKFAQHISAKQLDDAARTVTVSLEERGRAFVLPEGASAVLRGLKPDGTGVLLGGVASGGNTVTFTLTENLLAASGEIAAEVAVYGPGEPVISTEIFYISVTRSLINDASVISTDEYSYLHELIESATLAVQVIASGDYVTYSDSYPSEAVQRTT
ncbi:MAG: BppU family phage baseplate upper protein, partial [Clostridia bacterium]|nr:BppU family phage baseplate upper protein [Clostridia bacterium]